MLRLPVRRTFLQRFGALLAAPAAGLARTPAQSGGPAEGGAGTTADLPKYALRQSHRTAKQSSYDTTGANHDSWPIAPGETKEVFAADGPGIVSHIWFTIASKSPGHLKELVLRMYWDGREKPSVEVPVGDFFGLNVGQYFNYQSAFLNCSSVKALNCYFAMPYRRSARMTITNEGTVGVDAFYSNIDYKLVGSVPAEAMYFHAQYRQVTPNQAIHYENPKNEQNADPRQNYTFVETRGSGHLMGVTLGVLQTADKWMGEGDDMTYIDNPERPAMNGTGSEDYFCGAWDFGGTGTKSIPFANSFNGAPFMSSAELQGGRYCLYRWHADNPITFERYLRHTIEHGHANDRADNFFSVAYWYAAEPQTDFPEFTPVRERTAVLGLA